MAACFIRSRPGVSTVSDCIHAFEGAAEQAEQNELILNSIKH